MKNREKIFKKIREWENELVYADPKRVAKLTQKIVKWKGQVFDEIQ